MTVAQLGQGTSITFGGSTVAEATNASFALDVDQVDVTSHDSPSRTREYIAGLIGTSNAVPVEVNWSTDFDTYFAIQGDITAAQTLSFTTPDASGTYSVSAWVKGIELRMPAAGEALTGTITFQPSGAWSMT